MLRIALIIAAALLTLESRGAQDEFKGRVLQVEHPDATQTFAAQDGPVREMVRAGLLRFTGQTNLKDAWNSLVSTQDTLGLKVFSSPGASSGTRQTVVAAIIETLLDSGFSPGKIIIWDKRSNELRLAGYYDLARRYGVGIAGALDEGYDPAVAYTNSLLGRLVYGDLEFNKRGEGIGRNSYVTTLLTQRITKIVNITPLLNHNFAGVSGVLYGLAMGSVDNVLRFESDPERLASSVPEIIALPEVGDRVALNIVDALLCQYRGEERTLLHYSVPLNQLWFSRDPVALDVLALNELSKQNPERKLSKATYSIYENSALLELGEADPRKIRTEALRLK